MGSYYTLLNALIEDGRIEEAEELFKMIFSRYMEGLPRTFFIKMISLYYSVGAYDKMFEVGNGVFFPSYFSIPSYKYAFVPSWSQLHWGFRDMKTVC